MKTIKSIARQVLNSENQLLRSSEKNYEIWSQSYMELHTFDSFKTAYKEFKEALISLGAKTKTVENRLGILNSAFKNGIDLSEYKSFLVLENSNKMIKKGVAKTIDGKVVSTPETTAKNQQEKELIKANNDNMLTEILTNAEFKKLKNLVAKNNWDANLVLKALLQK